MVDDEVDEMLAATQTSLAKFVVGGSGPGAGGTGFRLAGGTVQLQLATAWGVSEAVIGLTIVAVGTSIARNGDLYCGRD